LLLYLRTERSSIVTLHFTKLFSSPDWEILIICVHHMPHKHGVVHGLGSSWADKGIVGVLPTDVTVYKAETPSYNAASEDNYMARAA